MAFSPTAAAVAAWAAETYAELPADARAASLRVRLSPSPLPRGQAVRVDVDGVRTVDRLRDALVEQLGGLRLADPLGLRLEVLDGSGSPIAGLTARGRLRSPADPPLDDEAPVPPSTTTSTTTTATGQAGRVLDLEPHTAHDLALLREMAGGAPADTSAEGWGRLAQGALGMALLTMHRAAEDARLREARMLSSLEHLAETARRAGSARDELLEEVLPAMIAAVGQAASATAESQITRAQADADAEVAAARSRGGSRVDDLARVMAELRETAVEVRRTKAMQALAGSAGASQPAPAEQQASQPAAGAPPATDPPPPAEPAQPSLLERILSGQVPAELAADAIVGMVDEGQRPHALALARAILRAAGEEVSQ